MRGIALSLVIAAGCVHYEDAPWTPELGGEAFGQTLGGQYHLGPVNFAGSAMRNSCGPYPDAIRGRLGPYLAIADAAAFPDPFSRAQLCDSCALVQTPDNSARVYVRIIGISDNANGFGDLFLSQEAFDVLDAAPSGGDDQMTWQIAECANTGPIVLQYAPDATPTETRLWARNQVVPLFIGVQRAGEDFINGLDPNEDGSATSIDGFGEGPFDVVLFDQRSSLMQMQHFESFMPGALVETTMQF